MAQSFYLFGRQLAEFTVPSINRCLADVILCCHRVDGGSARFTEDLRYLTFRMLNGFRHTSVPVYLLGVSLSTDAIPNGVTLRLGSK